MMGAANLTATVPYIDTAQMERDLDVQRQCKSASRRGPSYFLAYGWDGKRHQPAVAASVTPPVVSKSTLARLSAQRLSAEADRAAALISSALRPYGLNVIREDKTVTQPFADESLVHLCDTMVCYIPYSTKGAVGRLVVKMTNFASGVAVPTKEGVYYRGVVPMQDATAERNTFRVLGVFADAEGKILGIDPRFTNKGIAWSVENVQAIIDACKRSVMR